jgi:phosphopantetheinyl transferase
MDISNIHRIDINPETTVYLLSYKAYEIRDYLDSLTHNEQNRLKSISHPTRQLEYVATRILRTSIFGKKEVLYSSIGAPSLNEDSFISISHTTNIVGIAVSAYQIGFDLEPIRDKAKKLSDKFLHPEEKKALDPNDDLEMTTVWSMKESLYKLAGRKKIIFKDELRLTKEETHWNGTIFNPNETIHTKMRTFHSGNNVLTINSAPIEIK